MSKKPGSTHQVDAAFALRVQQQLSADVAEVSDLEGRIAGALTCAALSVLAAPGVHKHLLVRIRDLLAPILRPDVLIELERDVRLARTLCYDGDSLIYVTVDEAARRLAVPTSTIYRRLYNSPLALSPGAVGTDGHIVHDDESMLPYRLSLETLRRLQTEPVEKSERERLVEGLERALPAFKQSVELTLEGLAESLQAGPLTVQAVVDLAQNNDVAVSAATVRRWPALRVDRSQRGRPRRVLDAHDVARRLATIRVKQLRQQIHASGMPLATLKRLARSLR